MNEENKASPQEYYDDSKFLKEFGINNIMEFYPYVQKQDLNLGKLEVTKLSPKQLNSLLGFSAGLARNACMAYFDQENHLIVTTYYRFQRQTEEQMDAVLYYTDSFGMNIDFIFGK